MLFFKGRMLAIADQKLVISTPRKSFLFDRKIPIGWLVWIEAPGHGQPLLIEYQDNELILPLNYKGHLKALSDLYFINKMKLAASNYVNAHHFFRDRFGFDCDDLCRLLEKPANEKDR